MSFDVDALRSREFPWAARGDVIYLNAASTGPLPMCTVREIARWAELRAEPHRMSDELQFDTLKRSRELVARMIGARPHEIALSTNTGFGVNLAARALPLGKGDVVITPDLEFPANVYPWMGAAAARGFTYVRLPTREGVIDEDELVDAIETRNGVKCVSVSWVGFALGQRLDLARIGAACRRKGAFLVVDAIQGVGPCKLDVHAARVDILTCGAQKWLLSPWGSGFVYVREELARSLDPPIVSWMAAQGTDDFRRLTEYDERWRDDARRYEQITLPYQDFAGMNASLDLLFELGTDSVVSHIGRLTDRVVEWAVDKGIPLATPRAREQRAGIVALRPRDARSSSARLKNAAVIHSYREGAIRISPHVYNTEADMDAALALFD